MGGLSFWPTGGGIGALESQQPWDRLTITAGGRVVAFPGICEVTPEPRKVEIDQRKPQGKHGGTLTSKGVPPVGIEIACTVWTAEQWEKLQKIVAVIMPKPRGAMTEAELKNKKEFQTFSIFHPSLSMLNICAVVIESVGPALPGSVAGSRTVKIKAREYFAPSKSDNTAVKKAAPTVAVVKEFQDKNAYSKGAKPANSSQPKPSTDKNFTGPNG